MANKEGIRQKSPLQCVQGGKTHSRKAKMAWLKVTALTFMAIIDVALAEGGGHNEKNFYLYKNPTRGVRRLDFGRKEDTSIACAVKCVTGYTECRSFMYNSKTGLCTPSSLLHDSESLPRPAEGDLFYSFQCEKHDGFRLMSYGNALACVGKFGPEVNYTTAEAACHGKAAYLASAKTMEKLKILRDLSALTGGNQSAWVGCDDRHTEGTYVWKEDGTSFTSETKPDTFRDNQPDNGYGLEDCVVMHDRASMMLNDVECDKTNNYVCEMLLI